VDRPATFALARQARRLFVKAGRDVLRFDAGNPITDADIAAYLVHQDGFLNVPVLVLDDLLVRGYTEALYHEALAGISR
jgi:hypothetical protein